MPNPYGCSTLLELDYLLDSLIVDNFWELMHVDYD